MNGKDQTASRIVGVKHDKHRIGHTLETEVELDLARNRDTRALLKLADEPRLVETGDHKYARAVDQAHLDQGQITLARPTRGHAVNLANHRALLADARLGNLAHRRHVDVTPRKGLEQVAQTMNAHGA